MGKSTLVTYSTTLLTTILYAGKYVKQRGLEVLDNQETNKDPVLFLKLILELKEKFDNIINGCCEFHLDVLSEHSC